MKQTIIIQPKNGVKLNFTHVRYDTRDPGWWGLIGAPSQSKFVNFKPRFPYALPILFNRVETSINKWINLKFQTIFKVKLLPSYLYPYSGANSFLRLDPRMTRTGLRVVIFSDKAKFPRVRVWSLLWGAVRKFFGSDAVPFRARPPSPVYVKHSPRSMSSSYPPDSEME
jgi:hypothetical protein